MSTRSFRASLLLRYQQVSASNPLVSAHPSRRGFGGLGRSGEWRASPLGPLGSRGSVACTECVGKSAHVAWQEVRVGIEKHLRRCPAAHLPDPLDWGSPGQVQTRPGVPKHVRCDPSAAPEEVQDDWVPGSPPEVLVADGAAAWSLEHQQVIGAKVRLDLAQHLG